ncbi:MAG: GNAT family N-acetyltransferase [Pseudomonadota bacterium]
MSERFEHPAGYVLDDDRTRLDKPVILDFLSGTYWAQSRPRESIWRGIEGAYPYGLYAADGRQAGLIRVISDGAGLAWIGDVFVLDAHRRLGLANWMLSCILAKSRFAGVRYWQLSTQDAHELYEPFGFKPFIGTGPFMTRDLGRWD